MTDFSAKACGERWEESAFENCGGDERFDSLDAAFTGIGNPIANGARHALEESLRAGLDDESVITEEFLDEAIGYADAKWNALRAEHDVAVLVDEIEDCAKSLVSEELAAIARNGDAEVRAIEILRTHGSLSACDDIEELVFDSLCATRDEDARLRRA